MTPIARPLRAAAAVAPWPLKLTGALYGVSAIVLNLVFLLLAARVFANGATEPKQMEPEKHLFGYSVFYLFALFAARSMSMRETPA